MNKIFTKRGMPMPFVIVTVGVGVALASLSLEAGFGQRCVDDSDRPRKYKCGGWWQFPDCQTYYDRRSNTCQYLNYSCCGLASKESYPGENPNDPALTVPPSW